MADMWSSKNHKINFPSVFRTNILEYENIPSTEYFTNFYEVGIKTISGSINRICL